MRAIAAKYFPEIFKFSTEQNGLLCEMNWIYDKFEIYDDRIKHDPFNFDDRKNLIGLDTDFHPFFVSLIWFNVRCQLRSHRDARLLKNYTLFIIEIEILFQRKSFVIRNNRWKKSKYLFISKIYFSQLQFRLE